MKKEFYQLNYVIVFFIAILLMLPYQLNAQAPDVMSYQAVIRDGDGNLVKSSQIGMRISILQNAPDGTEVYAEEYTTETNIGGLVTLEIGLASQEATGTVLKSTGSTSATAVSGDFSAIVWADGPYFIKVETDPAGGTNYTITGVSQLLSVPYALYAGKAANVKFTDGTNSSDAVYTGGNVGIGTTVPESPLQIATNAVPAITISSLTTNNPDRPGIMFKNNNSHFISGDGLSDEMFGFYSVWSSTRTYDAKLKVFGKAGSSWGTYIELTHNGTDGMIRTDVGDINIAPAGSVTVNGDLLVTGKISGTFDTINVSQITGLTGQGYTAVFPQVLDNTATVEISGITLTEDVVIVSTVGTETDRITVNQGVDSNGNPVYKESAGLTMEFPLIFETANSADIQSLKNWFDQADPDARSLSLLIKNLAGNETGRWNMYEYKPDGYEAGTDGRTKFTLVHDGVPDNVNSCVYSNDFGSEHSFDPATDKLVEIASVATGTDFTPAVEVNTVERTITLTITYNEGYQIYNWVKSTIVGDDTSTSMSVIETTDGTPATETSRTNFFNCIPIKYEHIYGFGLNTKLKARIVIAYGSSEEG